MSNSICLIAARVQDRFYLVFWCLVPVYFISIFHPLLTDSHHWTRNSLFRAPWVHRPVQWKCDSAPSDLRYKEDEVPRSLWKDVLKSLPHGCFSGGSSIDGWWFRFTVLCWLIHYAWTDFEYAWIKLIVSREKHINSIIVMSLSRFSISIYIYLSIDIPHVLVLIFLCELAIQERTAHIPCSQNQVCFFIPLRVHMGLYSHLPHCSGEKELSGIQSHQTSWMAIRPSTGVESVIYRVGQWCLMLITAIVVNKKDLIVIPWRLHTAETMMIITKCELLVFFFSCSARWIPNFQLVYHYFKYQ